MDPANDTVEKLKQIKAPAEVVTLITHMYITPVEHDHVVVIQIKGTLYMFLINGGQPIVMSGKTAKDEALAAIQKQFAVTTVGQPYNNHITDLPSLEHINHDMGRASHEVRMALMGYSGYIYICVKCPRCQMDTSGLIVLSREEGNRTITHIISDPQILFSLPT